MNFVPLTKRHRHWGRYVASRVYPRQLAARKQEPLNPEGGICPAQGTGSARDTWISPLTARKSLIIENSTATSHLSFATSHRRFAMSLFSGHRRAPYSSLLSKLLKEKKKEGFGKKESDDIESPRVDPDLPSIEGGAYFLGHASHGSAKGDSWQLMASVPFEISHLAINQMPPTYPRVALPVVRCGAPRRLG